MSTAVSKTSNVIIISGSNSRKLANSLGVINDLPVLQHKVVHFINSEIKVALPFKLEPNTKVWIIQSTSNPANDNLMEIFLLVDTLFIEGIRDINLVIPYYGYSRQDKQHLSGECMSIAMITRIFKKLGVKKVLTTDIHNANILATLPLTVEDNSCLPIMAREIYKKLGLNLESEKEFIVGSPDQGGVFRCDLFAANFYQDQSNSKTISVKKERELSKVHFSKAVELYGEIDRKKLILIDDVSTSGGTIINAVELCKANNVDEIYVVIVHADFAKGVLERFENNEVIKTLFTTNTIEKPVEDLDWFQKIVVIDIAGSIKL
jgi:ribose-phosphate pyrophosphokinase